ncbi:hypothetical protein ACH4NS_09305 [Streptomyces mutabilis]|jgi:hypothetical protein|uniref:hypothetical protein n=1 Tax=Streptomyces mutabilis TaxID=67332 RepID=UPI00117E7866|nr:hypothetical protein [Streptomyces sp. Alain-F2R5]MDG9692381.1 hypothetical protein [Streptomyces sp. DH17]
MSSTRLAILSLCAVSLTALQAGTAQAGEEKATFENNTQILSCVNIEVLDLPIASVSGTTIDCSDHHEESTTASSSRG